jgi:predicted enzyme related to lactoylglutathione lyase
MSAADTTGHDAVAWAAVTIDCRDTNRVATFWSALLDAPAVPAGSDRPGWFRVRPTVRGGPAINFQPVPEDHAGKAPVHLDLWVRDLDAAVAIVERLGGERVAGVEQLPRGRIVVMRDPEGHEFCLLASPAGPS